MKRSKPLRRKTPLRTRSTTKKYRRRDRDLDYMKDVRQLPCVVRAWLVLGDIGPYVPNQRTTTCEGEVQADHLGRRGLGQKADDDTCAAICRKHHGERTDVRGMFRHWTAGQMQDWCDWAIAFTRTQVENLRAIRSYYA